MEERVCEFCNKPFNGRVDKKFCDPYCKSSYHYQKSKEEAPKFYNKVDNQLKLNRRILKKFNKSGKATVRSETVNKLGFNPNFFTHYWKNKKGDVYLFVYEFGFLKRKEQQKEKYILIHWQEYMN